MSDLLTDIATAADELTNPVRVHERYEQWINRNKVTKYHDHTLPSLLDQLAAAAVPGEAYIEDQGGHVHRQPRSIPPARLEAINAYIQIDAGAALWAHRAGLTPREQAASNIRALVGAQTDSDMARAILTDLRRWYGWAATLTGWERPSWKPAVPCPACEQRGLRVRLDLKTAACVNCGCSWTPDTIGILADYVRGLAVGA